MDKIKAFLKEHPLVKTLLLMLLVSIGILIVLSFCLRLYSRHGQEFEMPDLIGKNVSDLNVVAEMSKLDCIVVDSIFTPNTVGGNILTQDPKCGQMVKKGRKVYITITSYNPEKAEVPNVTDGATLKSAVRQLAKAGLEVGYLTFTESEFGGDNIVERQMYKGHDVVPGTVLEGNSRIDLVVSCSANSTTNIPFVIGKTPQEARKSIVSASLNVGVEHFEHPDDRLHSRVYDMQPNKIGKVPYGTVIELWYRSESGTNFEKVRKNYVRDNPPEPVEQDTASVEKNQVQNPNEVQEYDGYDW